MQTRWSACENRSALERDAIERIARASADALAWRGRFTIVLAGGETPRRVYRALRSLDTAWPRWHVYFGDERCVPEGDPRRNSAMADDAWLAHVSIPPDQLNVIPAERGPVDGARAYARMLSDVDEFDLVLLGLGEDGHTASLFPGHDWGTNPDAPDALAVFGAPKPPPERVSLSAARLSRARAVLFLVSGESKRDAVERWRRGEPIPAAAIRCPAGVDVLVEGALFE